jgi:hypothetical protein
MIRERTGRIWVWHKGRRHCRPHRSRRRSCKRDCASCSPRNRNSPPVPVGHSIPRKDSVPIDGRGRRTRAFRSPPDSFDIPPPCIRSRSIGYQIPTRQLPLSLSFWCGCGWGCSWLFSGRARVVVAQDRHRCCVAAAAAAAEILSGHGSR